VLGHSQCGAILATLEELGRATEHQSGNLRSIVDRVRPSVEALLATDLRNDTAALVRESVRANVRASVDRLRHGSAILERLIAEEGLRIIGAEYSLETGTVTFSRAYLPARRRRANSSQLGRGQRPRCYHRSDRLRA